MNSNALNIQQELSLVVATIDRVDELKRLLDSLCHQSMQNFEVIVVDQSSLDMQPEIERLTLEFGRQISVKYVKDKGRGLSRARNLGLRHASGTYIGFPDDDCWYSEHVTEQVISFFRKNPHCGILSGCYTEPNAHNSNFPNVATRLSPSNLIGRASSVGIFLNLMLIGTQNIQFDERIGAGTNMPVAEEIDLLLRLLIQGIKGIYDPSLVVFHKIFREKALTQEQFIALRKAYWYVIGKNYQPFYSEAKLLRGFAACLINHSSFGSGALIRSIISGYSEGLRARRSQFNQ